MMEKFRSLSFSTRTFVVASGVVITSIGAYLLYEKLKRQRRGMVASFASTCPENATSDSLHGFQSIPRTTQRPRRKKDELIEILGLFYGSGLPFNGI